MKKLISVLLIAFVVLWASPAFAVQCQRSNVAGTAGTCWDLVEIASSETTLVSAGAILVRDINNGINSTEAAWRVKVATATGDGVYVAGVAQGKIVTGNQALVLVRGPGVVKVGGTAGIANTTSGEAIYVGISGNASDTTTTTTTVAPIGYALENESSGDTTIDAYLTIM